MPRGIPYVGDAGNGARLLARYRNLGEGTKTEYVPDNAGWCDARAVGGGGTAKVDDIGGAGAAYARAGFAVTPGQVVQFVAPPSRTAYANLDGADASVSLDGTTKVLAKGGGKGVSGSSPGGSALSCIGDVKRSGGSGGSLGTIATSTGANGLGGPGATLANGGGQANGGSSGGDFIDTDSLSTGGFGGGLGGFQVPPGPGGGASGRGGGPDVTPGPALAWIEFWTSNPNL